MPEATQQKSVTDYLNALVWDGTPRIDRWLVDCAGADDTPDVRAVSRALLVAAVRRARHPGCQFDQMLVLEGPQGCGKSSALRLLAVDDAWFTDDAPITDDARKIIEATHGKWIVEMAELTGTGMDRSDSAAFKSFLSRSADVARMPYQRDQTRVLRQFVVVGTSGSSDYLRDTGSRRFWPVRVRRFDLKRLAEVRDQLWAEAAVIEATGEAIDPARAV